MLGALCVPLFAQAAVLLDSDHDGLPDIWEVQIFHTDPFKADSDGDGFSDGTEVRYGFDPNNPKSGARLVESDYDHDGVSDSKEVMLGTDPMSADTDGDHYTDGTEIASAHSPTSTSPVLLQKSILVDLSEQKLYQELGGVVIATYKVSSGKASTPTPIGTYKIQTKTLRAWSGSAKLWMPYWMGFKGWTYGIHELPEWPDGKKEGASHLGRPVSHGCVRLGVGAAKTLYDWSPIGTLVTIQR